MHFVYILQSVSGDHFYVGLTADIEKRLKSHNAGQVPHTAKFKPWMVKSYVAFQDWLRAASFEAYLKSASGRAFAKKRL